MLYLSVVTGKLRELHTLEDARALLRELGAPEQLLTHAKLVGEAAEALVMRLVSMRVPVNTHLVRLGAALHDAGKM